MEKETLILLNGINQAIIKYRGMYSGWSNKHNISYHEMLVLYEIRDSGFCTQKQICENYLLPKQTINNVITAMRKDGILVYDESHSTGREKAFVLSDYGKQYAALLLASLNAVETRALDIIGKDTLQTLTNFMLEYDQALKTAFDEEKEPAETAL